MHIEIFRNFILFVFENDICEEQKYLISPGNRSLFMEIPVLSYDIITKAN